MADDYDIGVYFDLSVLFFCLFVCLLMVTKAPTYPLETHAVLGLGEIHLEKLMHEDVRTVMNKLLSKYLLLK